jgi:magnesium transporter
MLTVYAADHHDAVIWHPGDAPPAQGRWFDLCSPDSAELQCIEAMTGVAMPTREAVSALGLAQRNREDDHMLHMQISLFADEEGGKDTPLGIALDERRMISLRYAESKTIEAAAALWRKGGDRSSAAAFSMLLETAINEVAAKMQSIAADVAKLSDEVFVEQRRRTPELQRMMIAVGRLEGRLARFRPSLLGFTRTLGFVENRAPEWLPKTACSRLKVIASDLKTLEEFDDQLTEKLQFLLDAILGFINTAQNAVMKLLTVVSVVTIPPVILAGVWGMNFEHMPELKKTWGYPAALATLMLSMLVPLAWFKARGWLEKD